MVVALLKKISSKVLKTMFKTFLQIGINKTSSEIIILCLEFHVQSAPINIINTNLFPIHGPRFKKFPLTPQGRSTSFPILSKTISPNLDTLQRKSLLMVDMIGRKLCEMFRQIFSCTRVQNQKIKMKKWTLSLLGRVTAQTKTSALAFRVEV